MVLISKIKKASICLLLCGLFANISALEVPQLKGRVNDTAGIINQHTEKQLDTYLDSLENTTGIQIAVLTIPSLQGEDISSYSLKVCEKWQLGEKGKDNGALLLVAYNDHQVRIETGYGLEDKLTDAKCGLIIRNVIIPEFKNGQYSEGILKGIQNMVGIASDNTELVARNVLEENEQDDSLSGIFFMIIWVIFFFIVISSKGGVFKWIILSNMLGGGRSGHYHSHSGGFHSSGFGGGSSFHGGGGNFGGGGASGHW